MAKKGRNKHERHNLALVNNHLAKIEGPKKKKWSFHDLRTIQPLTDNQNEMFQSWFQGSNICATGSAGSGKTFVALYLALSEIFNQDAQDKIILLRSAVPTRDVGFLPGTLEEKTAVYELPYHDICHELIGKRSTYQDMKDAGVIEFMTTSHVRGLTWDNAVVVVDESENLTFHEINSIMTRLGQNTRIIFAGDLVQTDLTGKRGDHSGMVNLLNVVHHMSEFDTITFTVDDVVRSQLVKSWIRASERIVK